jgi:hypothetical protein
MIGRHITVPALEANSILPRACDKCSKILGEAGASESQARHWNFLADSWIVTHGIRNLADIHFSKTVAYKAVRLDLKRS